MLGWFYLCHCSQRGLLIARARCHGGAIKEQQEEQERQNRREQLKNLFNELIKQEGTVDITVGNMELRIKQRKMVGTTIDNKNLSLTECVLGAIGIIMVCCLPLLALIIIERLG